MPGRFRTRAGHPAGSGAPKRDPAVAAMTRWMHVAMAGMDRIEAPR
ncbi:MAG: hypothetical protein AB1576_00950 [Bacillota bacterium]